MDTIKKNRNWDAGILPSAILAAGSLLLFINSIVLSILADGDAGPLIGLLPVGMLLSGIAGVIISVKAIRAHSEPAGLIRVLSGFHVLTVFGVIALYVYGILQFL